jgi:hypothetical protein
MVQDLIELNEPSWLGTTSPLNSSLSAANVSMSQPRHDGLRQATARAIARGRVLSFFATAKAATAKPQDRQIGCNPGVGPIAAFRQ